MRSTAMTKAKKAKAAAKQRALARELRSQADAAERKAMKLDAEIALAQDEEE